MTDQPNDPVGNAIVTQSNTTMVVRAELKKRQPLLQAMLPKHINVGQLRVAVETEMARTPRLSECVPLSIVGCAFEAAHYGLIPCSFRNIASLVPFRRGDVTECKLIVGYQGFRDMAYRHPKVLAFDVPRFAYPEDDFYREYGTNAHIRHVPANEDSEQDWTYVYVCVELREARPVFACWSREQCEKLRAGILQRTHKTLQHDVPWVTSFDQMSAKTVTKRVCNVLPASTEMVLAVTRGDRDDAGKWEPFDPTTMAPPQENGNGNGASRDQVL